MKNAKCYKRMLEAWRENENVGADDMVFIEGHFSSLWKGWTQRPATLLQLFACPLYSSPDL